MSSAPQGLSFWMLVPDANLHVIISNVVHIDDLVQECSISSALAMEILQSCIKPSIYSLYNYMVWSKHVNWPNSQIPQCTTTSAISHNAPFGTEMCSFLLWVVPYGSGALWDLYDWSISDVFRKFCVVNKISTCLFELYGIFFWGQNMQKELTTRSISLHEKLSWPLVQSD